MSYQIKIPQTVSLFFGGLILSTSLAAVARPVVIISTHTFKPGSATKIIPILDKLVKEVTKQPGVMRYEYFKGPGKNQYTFIEKYASKGLLLSHSRSAVLLNARRLVAPLVVGSVKPMFLTPCSMTKRHKSSGGSIWC